MSHCVTSASDAAPLSRVSWQLQSEGKPQGHTIWRLSVDFPEKCSFWPPGGVEYAGHELRLLSSQPPATGQRCWHLPVPSCAQPIGDDATCRLVRRHRRLVVEWLRQAASFSAPAGVVDAGQPFSGTDDGSICGQLYSREVGSGAYSSGEASCGAASEERDTTDCGSFGDSQAAASSTTSKEGRGSCSVCGTQATCCCSQCKLLWYCGRQCQRLHWAQDHKFRCALGARVVTADRQLRRGDPELALVTAEPILKDIVSQVKKESEKEYTYSASVISSLLRAFADCLVVLASSIAEPKVPDGKCCRSMFVALATLLDAAAFIGKPRRPLELQFHIDSIVAGLEGQLNKEADPVLSAWMFYDAYARGFEDRFSKYEKNAAKLRAAALIGFRDALALAHDVLRASTTAVDHKSAARVDELLDVSRLQVSVDGFHELKPFVHNELEEYRAQEEARRRAADPDSD